MYLEITEKEDLEKFAKIKKNISALVNISSSYHDKEFGAYQTNIINFLQAIGAANQFFDAWYRLITPFNTAIAEFNSLLEILQKPESSNPPKDMEDFLKKVRNYLENTKEQIGFLIKKYEIPSGSEQKSLTVLIKSIKETDLAQKIKATIKNYLNSPENSFNFISFLCIKLRNNEEEKFKAKNERDFLEIEKFYKEKNLFLTEKISEINEAFDEKYGGAKKANEEEKANLLIFKEQLEKDKKNNSKYFFIISAEMLRKKLKLSGSLYGDNGCYRQIASESGFSWHNHCWMREIFFTSNKPETEKNSLTDFYHKNNSFNEKFLEFIEFQYPNSRNRKSSFPIIRTVVDNFFSDFLISFLGNKPLYELISDYASQKSGSGGKRSISAEFSSYCIDKFKEIVKIDLNNKTVSLIYETIKPFLKDLKIDENQIIFAGIIIEVYYLLGILDNLKDKILNRETANRHAQTPRLSPKKNLANQNSKSPRNSSFFYQSDDYDQLVTSRTYKLVSRIVSEIDTKELHLELAKNYLRIIGETIDTLNLLKNFPENFSITLNEIFRELKKHQSTILPILENLTSSVHPEIKITTPTNIIQPKSSSSSLPTLPRLNFKRFSIV